MDKHRRECKVVCKEGYLTSAAMVESACVRRRPHSFFDPLHHISFTQEQALKHTHQQDLMHQLNVAACCVLLGVHRGIFEKRFHSNPCTNFLAFPSP